MIPAAKKSGFETKAKNSAIQRNDRHGSVPAQKRISGAVTTQIEGPVGAERRDGGDTELNLAIRDAARRIRERPNDKELKRALFEIVTGFVRPHLIFATKNLLRDATSRQNAADIVQEALTRVYPKVDRLALSGKAETLASPQAYIRRIAQTMMIDAVKACRRPESALNEEIYDPRTKTDPINSTIRREEMERMQVAMGHLDQSDRLVLKLVYVFQLTHDEAGELIGISPATMRVRKHRAVQRLKAAMGEGPSGTSN